MSGHEITLRVPSVHITLCRRDPGNSNKVAGNAARIGTNSSCQRSKVPRLTGWRRVALSLAVWRRASPGVRCPRASQRVTRSWVVSAFGT